MRRGVFSLRLALPPRQPLEGWGAPRLRARCQGARTVRYERLPKQPKHIHLDRSQALVDLDLACEMTQMTDDASAPRCPSMMPERRMKGHGRATPTMPIGEWRLLLEAVDIANGVCRVG